MLLLPYLLSGRQGAQKSRSLSSSFPWTSSIFWHFTTGAVNISLCSHFLSDAIQLVVTAATSRENFLQLETSLGAIRSGIAPAEAANIEVVASDLFWVGGWSPPNLTKRSFPIWENDFFHSLFLYSHLIDNYLYSKWLKLKAIPLRIFTSVKRHSWNQSESSPWFLPTTHLQSFPLLTSLIEDQWNCWHNLYPSRI